MLVSPSEVVAKHSRENQHVRYFSSLSTLHPDEPDILLDGRYEATILAGDSPQAFNDVEHPNRVVPERTQVPFKKGVVSLLPHSLTIVRIPWK
jgi:hypothetical protein